MEQSTQDEQSKRERYQQFRKNKRQRQRERKQIFDSKHARLRGMPTRADLELQDIRRRAANEEKAAAIENSIDDAAVRNLWDCEHIELGCQVDLEIRTSSQLSPADLEGLFKIVCETSSTDYESSSVGWDPEKKKRELADPMMMHVLIRAAHKDNHVTFEDGVPVNILGFMSFMVDNDDPPFQENQVIYIFELHVAKIFRKRGVGKWLIHMAEHAGKVSGINKIMLTVFTANKDAIRLYNKLGFNTDQSSPPDRVIRYRTVEADYKIMSRMTGGLYDGLSSTSGLPLQLRSG